jgi:cell division protein YceG involved in septum cleavage
LRKVDKLEEKLEFLDHNYLPAPNVELALQKMVKVRRLLVNYFPEKKQFKEFLCQSLGVGESELTRTLIKNKDLKSVVDSLLEKVDLKIDKRLLEGFFANFTYNKKGKANGEEICKVIYDEKQADFLLKVTSRNRGPPPTYDDSCKELLHLTEDDLRLRL